MAELESFRLKRYKSIEDTGELELSGITFLLGPNSSGKTNIIESLLLLKQTVGAENLSSALVLNGDQVKLGEHSDIAHMRNMAHPIEYEFNISRDNTATDKQHECPICNKGYKTRGWYTKHIESKHPHFWESVEDISFFEDFYTNNSTIRVKYEFDKASETVLLKEFEFENPPPQSGLFLSDIKLRSGTQGDIQLLFHDINGENILNLRINDITTFEEEFSEVYNEVFPEYEISNINKIPDFIYLLFYALTSEKTTTSRLHRTIPTREKDELYPTVQDEIGHIGEVTEKSIKEMPEEVDDILIGFLSRAQMAMRSANIYMEKIVSFLENISHVGPLRRNPQRIYFGSGERPEEVGSYGQNLEEMLFRDVQIEKSELIKETNSWLEESGFNCQLAINRVGVSDLYQIRVEEGGLDVNLADVGFGLSQTLPIITECISKELDMEEDDEEVTTFPRIAFRTGGVFRRDEEDNYTVMMEQPEIHLNPSIEADLGDFFINAAQSDIGLIIETHSEHIINRMQRRIIDGTISPDDVTIYFASKTENKTTIEESSISEDGEFSYWPEGFFQDDFDEAIEMMRTSLKEGDQDG